MYASTIKHLERGRTLCLTDVQAVMDKTANFFKRLTKDTTYR
jgi:hypothetical protein